MRGLNDNSTAYKLACELLDLTTDQPRKSPAPRQQPPERSRLHENPPTELNVTECQEALRAKPDAEGFLLTDRHLSPDIIDSRRLGYDVKTKRYTLPIYDADENLLDIRLYGPGQKAKVLPWCTGLDTGAVLFGYYEVKHESVLVFTEGEMDCLALCSVGIPAFAVTLGATKWPKVDPDLSEKIILVWGDRDEEGRKHNSVEPENCYRSGALEVYTVSWPEGEEKMDPTSYLQEGGTPKGLRALMDAATLVPKSIRANLTAALVAVSPHPTAAGASAERVEPRSENLLEQAIPRTGFLRTWLDYTTETTESPEQYCLAVGLALMAAAIGRQAYYVWGDTGLYPNIYVALLGRQGSPHKTTPVAMGRRLLNDCWPATTQTIDAPARIGKVIPWDMSVEGLVKGLDQSPQGIIIAGELSALFAVANRSYNQGMSALLADLYDAHDTHERLLKGSLTIIRKPAPTIIGATTLSWFAEQITQVDLHGGLLSRFLYFPAGGPAKKFPIRPKADQKKLNSLKRLLKEDVAGGLSGNCPMQFAPEPLEEYSAYYVADSTFPFEGQLEGFMTRLKISSVKLAMLYQQSACPGSATIELPAWRHSYALVQYLEQSAYRFIDRVGGDDETNRRRRVLAFIRRHPDGVAHSLVLNGIRNCNADQLRRDITTLEQSGLVTVTGEAHGTDTKKRRYLPVANTDVWEDE